MMRVAMAMVTVALVMAAPAQAQGPAEGIFVRGHWVLEVRNVDGSLAGRQEFDNALVAGEEILVSLLSRNRSMGRWQIELETDTYFTYNDPFGARSGHIVEPHWPTAGQPGYFSNLQLNPPSNNTFPGTPALELSGTATAVTNGVITHVGTRATTCPANVVADSCFDNNALIFSNTRVPDLTPPETPEGYYLPDGLLISAGQIVQVKVTISFASAPHPPSF